MHVINDLKQRIGVSVSANLWEQESIFVYVIMTQNVAQILSPVVYLSHGEELNVSIWRLIGLTLQNLEFSYSS